MSRTTPIGGKFITVENALKTFFGGASKVYQKAAKKDNSKGIVRALQC